ncbi:MAG: hypothetical protein Q7R78_02660 [bacterium]|nr:hypothetical protein [bacterium]
MINQNRHTSSHLRRDILIFLLSVLIAVLLLQLGVFSRFLDLFGGSKELASFVSGIFFTSLFTTPISIASLSELSVGANPLTISLFAAMGAVIGDLIIFLFIRDVVSEDLKNLMSNVNIKKVRNIFKFRLFRWLVPFVGALVIASPLPDELGLAMIGLSRMHIWILIPVSFVMNFIGVYLICFVKVIV